MDKQTIDQITEMNVTDQREPDQREPVQNQRKLKRNPRWFILPDPDSFFRDLLMEQSEQA